MNVTMAGALLPDWRRINDKRPPKFDVLIRLQYTPIFKFWIIYAFIYPNIKPYVMIFSLVASKLSQSERNFRSLSAITSPNYPKHGGNSAHFQP